MDSSKNIISKALNLEQICFDDLIHLYKNESFSTLINISNSIRHTLHQKNEVGWMIDRNINITNVCVSGCKFCSFHCSVKSKKAYITSFQEYEEKINELLITGGSQILLQGGMHPNLSLAFYEDLFAKLKYRFPQLKLHALGPPEIFYLAQKSNISIGETLKRLIKAGLDSLPGAGAEILDNEIRKKISPNKCSADDWLNVMLEAHKLNLPTSATMVYGHIESLEDRINHLIKIRDVQNQKPASNFGFLSFIIWPMQKQNSTFSPSEYLKMIAISRIALVNVPNIQSSLLTVGTKTAQLSLFAGANDLGSIMMEENVLSAVGAGYRVNASKMKKIIIDSGFIPILRTQKFEKITD